jgi:hypothetical protein
MEKGMTSETENSTKETLKKEKLKAEDDKSLSKEQERSRVHFAREQEIEKGLKIKENKRAVNRVSQEIKEQARDKVRKDAYIAREKKLAEEQAARKSKTIGY